MNALVLERNVSGLLLRLLDPRDTLTNDTVFRHFPLLWLLSPLVTGIMFGCWLSSATQLTWSIASAEIEHDGAQLREQ